MEQPKGKAAIIEQVRATHAELIAAPAGVSAHEHYATYQRALQRWRVRLGGRP